MSKVFVTGATGFVGYYIATHLQSTGHSVKALVRNESRLNHLPELKKCDILLGELSDHDLLKSACQDMDVVVHAAADVSFDTSFKKQIHKTNVDYTSQLLNICLDFSIPYFIYISSIAALGGNPDQTSFDENTEWYTSQGKSVYAESKHLAEMEVWRANAEGLNTFILSPSVVLGAWYDPSHHSEQLKNYVKNGNYFYPTGSTGWVDVRDIARAVVIGIDKKISDERIILNGCNLSYKEVFELIGGYTHVKAPDQALHKGFSMFASYVISTWGKIFRKKIKMQPDIARSLFSKDEYSNQKSKDLLHLEYTPIQDTVQFSMGPFA